MVTQARGDAGSAQGGIFEERGVGGLGWRKRVGIYLGFWLEQLCGWGSFTAMGKMGSNRHFL